MEGNSDGRMVPINNCSCTAEWRRVWRALMKLSCGVVALEGELEGVAVENEDMDGDGG